MDELCSTCLSKQRTLVPSTIEVVSSLLETVSFIRSSVLVCWECNSRIQKMQAFKAQATKAQELLKLLYQESKKPPKALQSLSNLSMGSTKIDYDETFVYCMKEETMECDEEFSDDLPSDIKYDAEFMEQIPKPEKLDADANESYQSESAENIDSYIQAPSKSQCVTADPVTEVGDKDGYDSDEWPLSQVVKDKDCKKDRNIKREPKNNKIERKVGKLNQNEVNFDLKIMSFAEMHRSREEDRKNARYVSCPFKCRSCITGYFTEERYKAHVLLKHSDELGPHICDICHSRLKRAELLTRHRVMHLRRYHCRSCQFNTHKLKLMVQHQSEHKVAKFCCEFCGFSTLKMGRLRYHVNKTHKKPPRCETCVKDFASEYSYKNHMRAKHGTGVKREKCTICGGMYRNLSAHAKTHEPSAPDAFCVECGVSFKSKHTLKKHLLESSKHVMQNDIEAVKWLICNECDRRFTSKTSLGRHIASQHTKQYPYNCAVCHKGFARRDRLRYHTLERHEGGQRPRDHVCSYCGRAFKKKQTLVNHIRTHTGERPFQCPHCPWSFAQRVTLRTHMRGLHPAAVAGNTDGTVPDNTAGAGGSGNTQDGGKRGKSEPLHSFLGLSS